MNKDPQGRCPAGWSLVEILVALTIFSMATVGVYLAMQGMNEAMRTAMQRNVEAAYINMLMGEVNPSDPEIETVYDVAVKTPLALPDNQTVYYTRLVDSCPNRHCRDLSPEVKRVHIEVFRHPEDTEAYRQYRRDIRPEQINLDLGADGYFVDALGQVWAPGNTVFNRGADPRRNGVLAGFQGKPYRQLQPVRLTANPELFQTGVEGRELRYAFHVAPNRFYTVELGFSEGATDLKPGMRVMAIRLNGSLLDTVDILRETGAPSTALIRRYRVRSMRIDPQTAHSSGVLTVQILPASGSLKIPRLAWLSLKSVP